MTKEFTSPTVGLNRLPDISESADSTDIGWMLNEDSTLNYTLINDTWTAAESSNKSLNAFDQLFHQPIHFQLRISVLWVLAIFGTFGNVLVLMWILSHRNWRSRINLVILHLTIADLLVIFVATYPQLAWEYAKRSWNLGDVMCRVVKFLQTVAISVSNYMVVVLAVDRYCAIRRPLKKQFPVSYMVGTAWALAVGLNCANLILYETKEIAGEIYCRNMLYDYPEEYMKAYITSIAVMVVFLPFIIICFSYARIFQKIAYKTSMSIQPDVHSTKQKSKPGKVRLQATVSTTLPKAKVKTFKIAVVIAISFLLCGTPYFFCDLWRLYGGQNISTTTWAFLGALAVSNSSTNPFVFLSFNSTGRWWMRFFSAGRRSGHRSKSGTIRSSSSNTATRSENNTTTTLESMRVSVKCCAHEQDTTATVTPDDGDETSVKNHVLMTSPNCTIGAVEATDIAMTTRPPPPQSLLLTTTSIVPFAPSEALTTVCACNQNNTEV